MPLRKPVQSGSMYICMYNKRSNTQINFMQNHNKSFQFIQYSFTNYIHEIKIGTLSLTQSERMTTQQQVK
jgi:hypothetical protein